MQIKKTTRAVSAALILLAPTLAHALSTGAIEGRSYLNQPLEARIPLTSATADELRSLRVNLAPSEVYQRAGIDLGSELAGLQFRIVTDAARPYILVTSRDSIRDPFLTFLVELSWGGGRLIREFTLLLDPPALMAPAAPPETRQAVIDPASSSSDLERVERPTPSAIQSTPATSARRSPAPDAEGKSAASGERRVRRGDTLWAIAGEQSHFEAVTRNQMMLAIYRRNPGAFDGNINQLKAGAILRMPSVEEMRAISRAAALAEVRRQNEEWRVGRRTAVASAPAAPVPASGPSTSSTTQVQDVPKTAAAPSRPRLELVAPDEATLAAAPSSQSHSAAGAGAESAPGVSTPLGTSGPEASSAAAAPGSTTGLGGAESGGEVTETPGLVQMDSTTALALQNTPEGAPEMPPADPAEAGADGVAALQPLPAAPEAAAPMAAQVPEDAGTGGRWWGVLAGLVVAGAAALGWLFYRRRKAEETANEETIDFVLDDGPKNNPATQEGVHPRSARQEPVIGSGVTGVMSDPDVDPTTDTDTQPGLSPFEKETALGVDQEDPLAEADFNLTYGLYEEALAVVEQALSRQPDRRDLKLKRLEVFFAMSDRESFLKYARLLAAEPQGQADSAWERCMVMGQQMFPDEPLFQNLPSGAAGDDFLDFNLDTSFDEGPGRVDAAPAGDERTTVLNHGADAAPAPGDDGDLQFESSETDLDLGTGTQSEDTVEKHLDMARVYLGMEEFAAAQRELDQALLEGSSEQQAEARELMEQVSQRAGMTRDATGQGYLVDVPGTGTLDIEDFGTRDDFGTRLDLARQYMELDDVEGARALIDEVIKDGTPEQRREAESLMAQLPARF
ncbi:MAG TPA: FimV/HubP family polar landmark protein [Candidatus Acidoferrales bacterium]|nr:FimV/HubP family polar landmark protein [Candidatus Acidoferrales bacterium]